MIQCCLLNTLSNINTVNIQRASIGGLYGFVLLQLFNWRRFQEVVWAGAGGLSRVPNFKCRLIRDRSSFRNWMLSRIMRIIGLRRQQINYKACADQRSWIQ